jgi:hypothetical protein
LQQPVVAGAEEQVEYDARVGLRRDLSSGDASVEDDRVLGPQRRDDLVLPPDREVAIVLHFRDQADEHGARAGT